MATKRKAKGKRRRPQASKKARKIAKAIGKAAVKGAGRAVKKGAKAVAERVTRETVVAQASRDYWKKEFPDPKGPQQLKMLKAESEEYEATFDGALDVRFTIWPDSNISVRDAAVQAAEAAHGPIAQSWTLTYVEAINDAAKAAFPQGVPW